MTTTQPVYNNLEKVMYILEDNVPEITAFMKGILKSDMSHVSSEKKPLMLVLFGTAKEAQLHFNKLLVGAIVADFNTDFTKQESSLIRYMDYDVLVMRQSATFENIHETFCQYLQTNRLVGVVGEFVEEYLQKPDFWAKEKILNSYICDNKMIGGFVYRGERPIVPAY